MSRGALFVMRSEITQLPQVNVMAMIVTVLP